MNEKNIKFHLPNGATMGATIGEITTASSFLSNLKQQERLRVNGEYCICKMDGTLINDNAELISLGVSELNITNKRIITPIPPKTFHQLGILVLDGSGSMLEKTNMNSTKTKEVDSAVTELFNRMNGSRVKHNFSFACVMFDTESSVTLPLTQFKLSELLSRNYSPVDEKGGGTHIFEGLRDAKKLADDFLNLAPDGGVPHKVLILLMSDGMCFEPEITITVADELKANNDIDIACAYFGKTGAGNSDPEAQKLLKEISSDGYYTTVYEGEALRAFFENSISQSSGAKIG